MALDTLHLDGVTVGEWHRALEQTSEDWGNLPASLPRQINHVDYVPPNVLLDAGRVSGVLDFEFTAPDYRVMDFAVGAYHFCLWQRPAGPVWPLLDTFAIACFPVTKLLEEEIRAVPAMLLRRKVVTALHWIGRCLVGHSSEAEATDRLNELLVLRQRLEVYGGQATDALLRQLDTAA